MGWLNDFLKPRQDNFMRYLIEQAELGVRGLEGLADYMRNPTSENEDRVNRAEKAADEVRRVLVDDLNRTFVTPIDREDIFALSRAVDDLLDYAHSTVDEMHILRVKPNQHLIQMASLLLESASEIHLALQRLETHPNVATEHARRAKRAENEIEKIYRKAIADLFAGPRDADGIVEMLKTREVYRHLSNAADRGDEAANIISDVVVKTT